MTAPPRWESILSTFVTVRPREISALLHASSCFFFILSAYFVVLPLRDEGALSLGLSTLPGLFVGSLVLTLIAAPLSTLVFSLPKLPRGRALALIHRFFGVSLVVFYILWHSSSPGFVLFYQKGLVSASQDQETEGHGDISGWAGHSWFYISVRIGLFLWVALLNLITISSTWARVIDVMDSESGPRLFGFIGAGATLGQLFGSLFATGMARLGPFLLLFAALLMELASQSSKGINRDLSNVPEELSPLNKPNLDTHNVHDQDAPSAKESSQGSHSSAKASSPRSYSSARGSSPRAHSSANGSSPRSHSSAKGSSPRSHSSAVKSQALAMLDGFRLILSSTYLLYVALLLWLSAVVSSSFYFQKVTVIAMTTSSAVGRRKLFAQINSFIAIFILFGQITLTGHILTVAGVTVAISAAPLVAFLNLVTIAVWPTWIVVAISETTRKVITYVVTRPGRELLFTVVSQEEKYIAKVCIDVVVQRLGDATAAGMFELLFSAWHAKPSTMSLFTLPVCLIWIATAIHVGKRRERLARLELSSSSSSVDSSNTAHSNNDAADHR